MKLIKAKNAAEAGKLAADIFEEIITANPECVLGLATGSTPLPLYRELIEREKAGKISFAKVRTANLDEYKGLSGDHPQSYRYFMNTNLFDHISIDKNNTIVPDGQVEDAEAMCAEYEKKIAALGGVDIQLLGIGHDGHIGFNEPCDEFPVNTHEVVLEEITREANKRFFASIDEVPTHARTTGIRDILQAKRVLMVASGENKAQAIKEAFFGPSTPMMPASILQYHPDFTLVADEAALSLL